MANHANSHAWEQGIRERQNWIAASQTLTGHSQASEHTAADGFQSLMSQPPVPTRLLHGTNVSGHHAQIFPGFALAPQLPSPGTQSEVGNMETEEPQPAGRKRVEEKQTEERAKKSKNVVEIDDSDGEEEENGRNQWTDAEVRQLIAFRSEMDKMFQKNVTKGGRTWEKLRARMVACCAGFNKSSEAYRNKWEAVFSHYGMEKRLLLISGKRLEVRCDFFDEIDKGFSDCGAVRNLVHGDAEGSPNPCPVDVSTMPKNNAKPSRKPRKQSLSELRLSLLAEMADATRQMADTMHEPAEVMKGFPILMERLIDKL